MAGGAELIEDAGFALDYLEVAPCRDAGADHLDQGRPDADAGGGASSGTTRLIDNIAV